MLRTNSPHCVKLPSLLETAKEGQRVYKVELKINNQRLTELIIDPHYELKHSGYINDELIYNLVLVLNGKRFVPKSRKDNWEYFEADLIYQNKSYFLVWCLEDGKSYLGVINCY